MLLEKIARDPRTETALYVCSAISLTAAKLASVYAASQPLLIAAIAGGVISLLGALLARYMRWSELPTPFTVSIRLSQHDNGVISGLEEALWKTNIYGTPVEVQQTAAQIENHDVPLFQKLTQFADGHNRFDPDKHWAAKLTVGDYVKWLRFQKGNRELVLPIQWVQRGGFYGDFNERMRTALQAARAFLFSASTKPTKISICFCHYEFLRPKLPYTREVSEALDAGKNRTAEQLQVIRNCWQQHMEQSASAHWANAFN